MTESITDYNQTATIASESITREVAEERLEEIKWLTDRKLPIDSIIEALFPPKFIPKPGEVIAVWGDSGHGVKFRKFTVMVLGRYGCEQESAGLSHNEWLNARPQTPEEKGD